MKLFAYENRNIFSPEGVKVSVLFDEYFHAIGLLFEEKNYTILLIPFIRMRTNRFPIGNISFR